MRGFPPTSPTRPQVDRMVADVVAQFGGLDVLINNAGIQIEAASDSDDARAVREACIAVNLRGTFLCSRAALRHFLATGDQGLDHQHQLGARA
jgi:glucose 1-dehydrogenase